jgi:formiminoglutamate deiminase
VTIAEVGGRFSEVRPDTTPPPDSLALPGLTLAGLANSHSHAFHRALRGRTQAGPGSFWSWRTAMYHLADRLDPEGYLALARATYAEMVLAGVTTVGEFHYLHHGPGGVPYDRPNLMADVLVEAAGAAGLRLTLLDTCYLAGGLDADGHTPLDPVQLRFSDGDADRWAERMAAIEPAPHLVVGAAVHSVRAVPREALARVARAAAGRPLHVHLSEQPAENRACQAFYGTSPTLLLEGAGVLGPATTAVHATHLTGADLAALGGSATAVCLCPTTERDLADGIGPAAALADAGSPLCLGSDQHAVIDPVEEARALEMDQRLATGERGRFGVADLVAALTVTGQACLGWTDAGRLEVGGRADLVHLRLDTVRTAGAAPDQALLAASAADIDRVVIDGATVVADGRHRLGEVAGLLRDAIEPLWADR